MSPIVTSSASAASPGLRVRDWAHCLLGDQRFLVSTVISDLGSLGFASVSVADLKRRSSTSSSEALVFPTGRSNAFAGPEGLGVDWRNRRCHVRLVRPRPGMRRLTVSMRRFDGEHTLDLEVMLDEDSSRREGTTNAYPDDLRLLASELSAGDGGSKPAPRRVRRVLGMAVFGGFRLAGRYHEFDGWDGLGLLDLHHDVRPPYGAWRLIMAQSYVDDRLVCVDVRMDDGEEGEATVSVDGSSHELGRMAFDMPRLVDGTFDLSGTWRLRGEGGSAELTFEPDFDRSGELDVAGVTIGRRRQVFGRLSGRVRLVDGRRVELTGLRAVAEHVYIRC